MAMKIVTTHSNGSATVSTSAGKTIRLTAGQVRKWFAPGSKTSK